MVRRSGAAAEGAAIPLLDEGDITRTGRRRELVHAGARRQVEVADGMPAPQQLEHRIRTVHDERAIRCSIPHHPATLRRSPRSSTGTSSARSSSPSPSASPSSPSSCSSPGCFHASRHALMIVFIDRTHSVPKFSGRRISRGANAAAKSSLPQSERSTILNGFFCA